MKRFSILLISLMVCCGTIIASGPSPTMSPASLRAEITALELELSSVIASGSDYTHLKLQLNELYAALPTREADPSLDQGGETCADATVIPALPYCDRGTTIGNVNDYAGSPDCSAYPPGGMGPDVVYTYTPTVDEIVTFSLCGSNYDTYLHVYANACPGEGNAVQVCCNDDDCDFTLQSCCRDVQLMANVTYYIVVDGWSANSMGDYELSVNYNDACEPCPQPPIVIPVWPVATAYCVDVSPGDREIVICGGPMPPATPDVTVTPGCDPNLTECFDPSCPPAFAEVLFWYYDMNDHCWHGVLSVLEEGCICVAYHGWITNDSCYFPYDDIDMGDLDSCNYGTQICNPSHGLSGVAWLGPMVNGEPAPNIFDLDQFDDGVIFNNLPWMPCTPVTVTVTVTGGPNWMQYELCGGQLFLNAWKDGNLDLDFCDELTCPDGIVVSEWVIQDVPVWPGVQNFTFMDPGVFDLGPYDLKIRFRLTSAPVGRFGHSWVDTTTCANQPCGTFAHDYLGEVEDYFFFEQQLYVELQSFQAIAGDGIVSLYWTTASETDNDHFEILRDDEPFGLVDGAGTSATSSEYSWIDETVVNGTAYTYTLTAVDVSGAREELASAEATPSITAGSVTEFALYQNYPNPFNARTSITFDLPEDILVSLRVFNVLGQEVAVLVNTELPQGRHVVYFDAAELPSAMYLYRLDAGSFTAQKKLVLLK